MGHHPGRKVTAGSNKAVAAFLPAMTICNTEGYWGPCISKTHSIKKISYSAYVVHCPNRTKMPSSQVITLYLQPA